MRRTTTAYTDLVAAIEANAAPCRGDDRYTADTLTPEEMGEVKEKCSACPVFLLCRDYAFAARPPAGIWAGKRWGAKKPSGRRPPAATKEGEG